MHERIRDALLQRWGRAVTDRPLLTIVICLILALLSIVLTIRELEFHSDRSELIDPGLSWNRRYAQYKQQFTRWDDLLVCFATDSVDSPVVGLARRIAERLRLDTRIAAADAGFLETQVDPRMFTYASSSEFDDALRKLRIGRILSSTQHANQALGLLLNNLASEATGKTSLDDLQHFLDPYLTAISGGQPNFDFLVQDDEGWTPLSSTSGRLIFIQVQFAGETTALAGMSENLSWLRAQVRNVIEADEIDNVQWGVTGISAIEADETAQTIRDSTLASIVAFVGITILMLVVFRGIVVPLLAAGSLLIGMAWSFGWLILTVGHLQLLSVVFSVILLGLGIDFALHLVARLELVQDEHKDLPSAMARVFRGIGPGMLTGAVTTAAAFASTAFTPKFKGMAEMGIIAGGGIILCLIAMLCFFPASLALTKRWKQIIRHRPGGEEAHFAHGRLDVVDRHPIPVLVIAAVVIGLALGSARNVRYDPNVLNLQPPGIESVQWEMKLVEDDERTVWSALIETTPEDAPSLIERLRDLPGVSDVGGMGLLYPANLDERLQRIQEVREMTLPSALIPEGMRALHQQLASVRQGLAFRLPTQPPDIALSLQGIIDKIEKAIDTGLDLPGNESEQRYQMLNEAFLAARSELVSRIEKALSPASFSAEDLPEFLRAQWISTDGTWLLQVFPTTDLQGRSILHPDRLGPFVNSIREVAPDVLGPPVQIYESSLLIVDAYTHAAVYAILAIFILLLLDFRSPADSICSLVPVSIGFVGAFGFMGLIDMPLNFANIIVLPMIFGIGVDAGVHMVHRWRLEPYGRPAGLSGATGRGITLTMITTMIGFGSLLLAEHRGIRSLGFVMLAGLGVTLLACYTILPPILRLRTDPPEAESP
ncbi:MAG: MMPL family transporter [Planctomycetes bacterium]|nr:MMPL family transporter [Planctomycetota bacterium]